MLVKTKHNILIGILVIFLPIYSYAVQPDENHKFLKNIYVEDQGSNKYEAAIKADRRAMRRVLSIVADKMAVPKASLAHVPYDILENLFEISHRKDEKYMNGWYSAIVDFAYEQHEVNNVILKYSGPKISKISYEFVFLPVYKQQNKIMLKAQDNLWIKKWSEIAQTLKNHKLYYPESKIEENVINSTNVLKLGYADYLSLFSNKLFKNVLIVVAELFTRGSGDAYLTVEYNLMTEQGVEKIYKEYPVSQFSGLDEEYTNSINDVLKEFGVRDGGDYQSRTKKNKVKNLDKGAAYNMYYEVYDMSNLAIVKSKLDKMSGEYSIEIKKGQGSEYTIDIKTKNSIEELAYQMYSHGLSFVKTGSRYHLIEVSTGI